MDRKLSPAPFVLAPLDRAEAEQACRWRYPPPYTMFDLSAADLDMLLDPELNYYAVRDRGGALAGIACFGTDAQVVGGHYHEPALDLGLGMTPALVGRGLGRPFVSAIIAFASRRFRPPLLRLSVAAFNARAMTTFRLCGFAPRRRFFGTTRDGTCEFYVMTRLPLLFHTERT